MRGDLTIVGEERAVVFDDRVERARPDRHRAQRVRKTRMFGGGEGEVCQPELTQPTHALHDREIEQRRLSRGKLDEAMDRVENALHPA